MHSDYDDPLKMAGMSTFERTIMSTFVASERASLSADELISFHPMAPIRANQILSRLEHKGWLRRIKRGIYAPVPLGASGPEPIVENSWLLAMDIFSPCCISGWTGAEYWELTEQIFNRVSLLTTRPQRSNLQEYGGISFRTRTIKEDRFFGTKKIWMGSQQVSIADPHRVVIDILDDPSFGGGARHTLDVLRAYWQSRHADPALILEYAQRYGRGTVFKRLGFSAERFGAVDSEWIEACQRAISAGVSNFDPSGPKKGKIISRWNIRLNIPVDDL